MSSLSRILTLDIPNFGANGNIVNDVRYNIGDFVHIDNGSSRHWIAKILEIRASDNYHVYMRVYWMYSPDDLPNKAAVSYGRTVESSPFYDHDELIVSNHSKLTAPQRNRQHNFDIDWFRLKWILSAF